MTHDCRFSADRIGPTICGTATSAVFELPFDVGSFHLGLAYLAQHRQEPTPAWLIEQILEVQPP